MKRFWSRAEATPAAGGFTVLLDGKTLRLPSGSGLTVPFSALADAIAAEWAEAGGAAKSFTPDDLPLTRLANTAQDRVRLHRDEIIGQLAAYGMNDLLCYRAEGQPELAERERTAWQPWLNWAERKYGVKILVTSGVVPIMQPPGNFVLFKAGLATMTDYQLAGLGVAVPALGSLVLGLAVEAAELTPGEACHLAHLSETFQEERWGTDDLLIVSRQKILDDVAVTARFMVLCKK